MSNYIERYWRDAKPEDAIKEPPMVARFRMYGDVPWIMGELHGTHTKDGRIWFDKRFCNSWTICQVYDAPDPGEGWRLIDIDKETKQPGDEYLAETGVWCKAGMEFGFRCRLDYRRRITSTVTYVPFTWEDREKLRGRWIYRIHANGTRDERMLDYAQQAADGEIEFGGFFPDTLVREWRFLDTGNPVGKEVTQ